MAILDLQGMEVKQASTSPNARSRNSRRCGGGASRLSLLLC